MNIQPSLFLLSKCKHVFHLTECVFIVVPLIWLYAIYSLLLDIQNIITLPLYHCYPLPFTSNLHEYILNSINRPNFYTSRSFARFSRIWFTDVYLKLFFNSFFRKPKSIKKKKHYFSYIFRAEIGPFLKYSSFKEKFYTFTIQKI